MADLASRTITEPKGSTNLSTADTTTSTVVAQTAAAQPVQDLAQTSTTSYSRPPETQPSVPSSVAAANAPITEMPYAPTTQGRPPVQVPITQSQPISAPEVGTRPVISIPIIPVPVTPVTTPVGDVGGGSGSGGGGGMLGGGAAEEPAAKGEVKKSWLPVILMATGLLVLFVKRKK